MNIQGYESLDTVLERGTKPLSPKAFETVATATKALILDTRNANDFAKSHIPKSINIGLDGSFAMWVGEMILDLKQEILLITDKGKEEEAIIRLSRVGYDHTIGYLEGGFDAWEKAGMETDSVQRITANELELNHKPTTLIIDVRKKSEFDSEHLINAINIPLNQINNHLSSFPKNEPFILHCAGGYRSMIAASILKQRGWDNFVDVEGGFAELSKTAIPKTAYICPTTLL
jgi:rhodanese-related sulfurtransferase